MAPPLVLVSGSPGAGKTALARRLAADLEMPLLSKDTIKEALGETLVVASVERSRELGRASVGVLCALVREELDDGHTRGWQYGGGSGEFSSVRKR